MHQPDLLARRDAQETLRTAAVERIDRCRLDALIHPFKSLPPPPHLERGVDQDNPFSPVTGLPVVLVPAGHARKENGPIAIEFHGPPWSGPALFRLAYAHQQIPRCASRRPARRRCQVSVSSTAPP
jgi:Asp-tRNA(Asn)/Glu-tRNA(Gln) amidotransferase A subunit family amidase